MMVGHDARLWFLIVTGDEFPDANEDLVRALAGAQRDTARRSRELGLHLRRAVTAIRANFHGQAERAFAAVLSPFVDGSDNYLDSAAKFFDTLGEMLWELALDIEYMKYVVVWELAMLAAEFMWATAMSAFFGPVPMIWFSGRLKMVRDLIKKLVKWVRSKLSLLGKPGRAFLAGMIVGEGNQLLVTAGSQAIQFAQHKRDHWTKEYLSDAAVVGAVGGVFALPMSAFGHRVGKTLANMLDSVFGKAHGARDRHRAFAHGVAHVLHESLHEGWTATVSTAILTQQFSMNWWDFTAGASSGVARVAGHLFGHFILKLANAAGITLIAYARNRAMKKGRRTGGRHDEIEYEKVPEPRLYSSLPEDLGSGAPIDGPRNDGGPEYDYVPPPRAYHRGPSIGHMSTPVTGDRFDSGTMTGPGRPGSTVDSPIPGGMPSTAELLTPDSASERSVSYDDDFLSSTMDKRADPSVPGGAFQASDGGDREAAITDVPGVTPVPRPLEPANHRLVPKTTAPEMMPDPRRSPPEGVSAPAGTPASRVFAGRGPGGGPKSWDEVAELAAYIERETEGRLAGNVAQMAAARRTLTDLVRAGALDEEQRKNLALITAYKGLSGNKPATATFVGAIAIRLGVVHPEWVTRNRLGGAGISPDETSESIVDGKVCREDKDYQRDQPFTDEIREAAGAAEHAAKARDAAASAEGRARYARGKAERALTDAIEALRIARGGVIGTEAALEQGEHREVNAWASLEIARAWGETDVDQAGRRLEAAKSYARDTVLSAEAAREAGRKAAEAVDRAQREVTAATEAHAAALARRDEAGAAADRARRASESVATMVRDARGEIANAERVFADARSAVEKLSRELEEVERRIAAIGPRTGEVDGQSITDDRLARTLSGSTIAGLSRAPSGFSVLSGSSVETGGSWEQGAPSRTPTGFSRASTSFRTRSTGLSRTSTGLSGTTLVAGRSGRADRPGFGTGLDMEVIEAEEEISEGRPAGEEAAEETTEDSEKSTDLENSTGFEKTTGFEMPADLGKTTDPGKGFDPGKEAGAGKTVKAGKTAGEGKAGGADDRAVADEKEPRTSDTAERRANLAETAHRLRSELDKAEMAAREADGKVRLARKVLAKIAPEVRSAAGETIIEANRADAARSAAETGRDQAETAAAEVKKAKGEAERAAEQGRTQAMFTLLSNVPPGLLLGIEHVGSLEDLVTLVAVETGLPAGHVREEIVALGGEGLVKAMNEGKLTINGPDGPVTLDGLTAELDRPADSRTKPPDPGRASVLDRRGVEHTIPRTEGSSRRMPIRIPLMVFEPVSLAALPTGIVRPMVFLGATGRRTLKFDAPSSITRDSTSTDRAAIDTTMTLTFRGRDGLPKVAGVDVGVRLATVVPGKTEPRSLSEAAVAELRRRGVSLPDKLGGEPRISYVGTSPGWEVKTTTKESRSLSNTGGSDGVLGGGFYGGMEHDWGSWFLGVFGEVGNGLAGGVNRVLDLEQTRTVVNQTLIYRIDAKAGTSTAASYAVVPAHAARAAGLPIPEHLQSARKVAASGARRYVIGTDEIVAVPGAGKIAELASRGLSRTGRAVVKAEFSGAGLAHIAVSNSLYGGHHVTWAEGDRDHTVVVHAMPVPPNETQPSGLTKLKLEDKTTRQSRQVVTSYRSVRGGLGGELRPVFHDNPAAGHKKPSPALGDRNPYQGGSTSSHNLPAAAVTADWAKTRINRSGRTAKDGRMSTFKGEFRDWDGALDVLVVHSSTPRPNRFQRWVLGDTMTSVGGPAATRLAEPPREEIDKAFAALGTGDEPVADVWRPGPGDTTASLVRGRIEGAIEVAVPADKLDWASAPLPESAMTAGLYVGTPPEMPGDAKLIHPAALGPYAAVEDVHVSRNHLEAVEIALAKRLFPISGPGRASRDSPFLGGTWSSPGTRRFTETRTEDGKEVRTTYWYKISSLMRLNDAARHAIAQVLGRVSARGIAALGLSGQSSGTGEMLQSGRVSDLTGALEVTQSYFAPRLVGVRDSGRLQRNQNGEAVVSSAVNRTKGGGGRFSVSAVPKRTGKWGANLRAGLIASADKTRGRTEDAMPGHKQSAEYRGPTAFLVFDTRTTFAAEMKIRNMIHTSTLDELPVIVHQPNGTLAQLPARHAVELYRSLGLPVPPELAAAVAAAKPPDPKAVAAQTLIPSGGEYASHNGTTVINSVLLGDDPLIAVRARLDELGVKGEWQQRVLEQVEGLLATPFGYVGLRDVLFGGDGAPIQVAASDALFDDVVDIRISAVRSGRAPEPSPAPTPLEPSELTNTSYLNTNRLDQTTTNKHFELPVEAGFTNRSKASTPPARPGPDGTLTPGKPGPGAPQGSFAPQPTAGRSNRRQVTEPTSVNVKSTSQMRIDKVATAHVEVNHELHIARRRAPMPGFEMLTIGLADLKDWDKEAVAPVAVPGAVDLFAPDQTVLPPLPRPREVPIIEVVAARPERDPLFLPNDGFHPATLGRYTIEQVRKAVYAQFSAKPLPPGVATPEAVEAAIKAKSAYTREGGAAEYVLNLMTLGTSLHGGLHAMATGENYRVRNLLAAKHFAFDKLFDLKLTIDYHELEIVKGPPEEVTLEIFHDLETSAPFGASKVESRLLGDTDHGTASGEAATAGDSGPVSARALPYGGGLPAHDRLIRATAGKTSQGGNTKYTGRFHLAKVKSAEVYAEISRHKSNRVAEFFSTPDSVVVVHSKDDMYVWVHEDLALRKGLLPANGKQPERDAAGMTMEAEKVAPVPQPTSAKPEREPEPEPGWKGWSENRILAADEIGRAAARLREETPALMADAKLMAEARKIVRRTVATRKLGDRLTEDLVLVVADRRVSRNETDTVRYSANLAARLEAVSEGWRHRLRLPGRGIAAGPIHRLPRRLSRFEYHWIRARIEYAERAEEYERRFADYVMGLDEVQKQFKRFVSVAWVNFPSEHLDEVGEDYSSVAGAVGKGRAVNERVKDSGNLREIVTLLWSMARNPAIKDVFPELHDRHPEVKAEHPHRRRTDAAEIMRGPTWKQLDADTQWAVMNQLYHRSRPDEVKPPLSELELPIAVNDGVLMWKPAARYFDLPLSVDGHKAAQSSGGLVKSGIAGSCYLLMRFARMARDFWAPDLDLRWVRLGVVAYMIATELHTYHETMRLGEAVDPSLTYANDLQGRYLDAAPLTVEELREHVAQGGLFPLEHALALVGWKEWKDGKTAKTEPAGAEPLEEAGSVWTRSRVHDEARAFMSTYTDEEYLRASLLLRAATDDLRVAEDADLVEFWGARADEANRLIAQALHDALEHPDVDPEAAEETADDLARDIVAGLYAEQSSHEGQRAVGGASPGSPMDLMDTDDELSLLGRAFHFRQKFHRLDAGRVGQVYAFSRGNSATRVTNIRDADGEMRGYAWFARNNTDPRTRESEVVEVCKPPSEDGEFVKLHGVTSDFSLMSGDNRMTIRGGFLSRSEFAELLSISDSSELRSGDGDSDFSEAIVSGDGDSEVSVVIVSGNRGEMTAPLPSDIDGLPGALAFDTGWDGNPPSASALVTTVPGSVRRSPNRAPVFAGRGGEGLVKIARRLTDSGSRAVVWLVSKEVSEDGHRLGRAVNLVRSGNDLYLVDTQAKTVDRVRMDGLREAAPGVGGIYAIVSDGKGHYLSVVRTRVPVAPGKDADPIDLAVYETEKSAYEMRNAADAGEDIFLPDLRGRLVQGLGGLRLVTSVVASPSYIAELSATLARDVIALVTGPAAGDPPRWLLFPPSGHPLPVKRGDLPPDVQALL